MRLLDYQSQHVVKGVLSALEILLTRACLLRGIGDPEAFGGGMLKHHK